VFKAYEKMGYDVLITLIVQLLSLLLVLIAAYLEMGFITIFAVLAFANLIKFFLSMILCYKRFLKPKIAINKTKIISLVKESFILGFNILIVQALLRVDVFILKALKDSVEVSFFYAPHSLILRLQTLPIAFSTALFPYFSRSACDGGDTTQTGFIRAFNVLFAASIVIMTIGMLFADQIIHVIYGKEYMGAVLSFRILLPSVVFLFIHPLLDFVLISQNKPSLMVPASLGGLLINIVLDFALIPRFGNVGASCASLVGYIAIFGITCYMARDIVTVPVGRFLYIPLGAIALISGVLYFYN
jgi:O-antigen/teichoic acid export membrane protein